MSKHTPDTSPLKNEENIFYVDEWQRIKERLKTAVSNELYDNWIDHFAIEQIDDKTITVGYYGAEPLKKFEKEYKESVQIHISLALGRMVKLKVIERKNSKLGPRTAKAKNNIRAAKLLALSLIFVVITVCVAVIGYNYIDNRNFRETFYTVSSLKTGNKVRIIQISDLYSCSYGKNNAKLIDRVEKLKPDLIIYTGDCLDSYSEDGYAERVVELCAKLAQTAPSYYIYGNNEIERFYDVPLTQEALDAKFGFDDESRRPEQLSEITDSFENTLESVGVKVLKNESDVVTVGSTNVEVYGVLTSNPSSFGSYAGESFDEFICQNTNNLKVTAVHEPLIFEEYSPDSWGDVLIGGHTHGGTVRVPMLGPLYTHEGGFFPERSGAFVYGRYEVVGKPLIVSSGLDNKNVLRINNNPELVIIDINRF